MINCAESVGSSSISICSSPSNENGLRTPSAGAKMLAQVRRNWTKKLTLSLQKLFHFSAFPLFRLHFEWKTKHFRSTFHFIHGYGFSLGQPFLHPFDMLYASALRISWVSSGTFDKPTFVPPLECICLPWVLPLWPGHG